MTSERSQAYGRVMKWLEDLGPSKLNADEQQTVRDTADALFFSEDLARDEQAQEALDELHALIDRLIESDRWLPETAERLLADVEGCGPLASVS